MGRVSESSAPCGQRPPESCNRKWDSGPSERGSATLSRTERSQDPAATGSSTPFSQLFLPHSVGLQGLELACLAADPTSYLKRDIHSPPQRLPLFAKHDIIRYPGSLGPAIRITSRQRKVHCVIQCPYIPRAVRAYCSRILSRLWQHLGSLSCRDSCWVQNWICISGSKATMRGIRGRG